MHFFQLLFLSFLFCGRVFISYAQPLDRGIEVYGVAEINVSPDEFYLHISIGEYFNNNKKIRLEELEKQLEKAVIVAGIPRENLLLEQVMSYDSPQEGQGKKREFLAGKQYSIKLSNTAAINTLLEKLDPLGIRHTYIGKVTHSKLADYQKEMRMKAVRAAQEKAANMLQSIGYKAGRLLHLQEIDQGNVQPMYMNANILERSTLEGSNVLNVEMQQIKITAQVRALFEIL